MADQQATTLKEKTRQLQTLVSQVVDKAQLTVQAQGYDPEKWRMMMVEAVVNNPSLIDIDTGELSYAALQACRWGILPDGINGVIIPFQGRARFIPMVGGLKAHMAHWIPGIIFQSGAIYENDEIEYSVSDDQNPTFKITRKGKAGNLLSGEMGKLVGAFCIAEMKEADGKTPRRFIEVIDSEQIRKARAASLSHSGGAWVQWPERMAEKTASNRLIKKAGYILNGLQSELNPEHRTSALIEKDDVEHEISKGDVKIIDAVKKEVNESAKPKKGKSPAKAKEEAAPEAKAEEPPPAEPEPSKPEPTPAADEKVVEASASPDLGLAPEQTEKAPADDDDGGFMPDESPKRESPPDDGGDTAATF